MPVKIDPEEFRDVVVKAIVENLTPHVKKEMVDEAINDLVNPQKNDYGYSWERGPGKSASKLQSMFVKAVGESAEKFMGELVSSDESIQAEIKKLADEAIRKVFSLDRNSITSKFADSFKDSFKYDN